MWTRRLEQIIEARLNKFTSIEDSDSNDGDSNDGAGDGADATGLGGGDKSSNNADNNSNDQGDDGAKWYLAPGVAGEGDAPEWLDTNKYKTAEDQAKAYIDANKKLSERDQLRGAPDDYEITLPEDVLALTASEDEAKELAQAPDYVKEWAKKYDLPNNALNELIGQFTKTELEGRPNREAEIKQLGSTAEQRIGRVGNFLTKQFGGEGSEELMTLAKGITSTAQGIQLFERLMTMNNNNLANEGDDQTDGEAISDEQLKEMLYAKDENGNRKMHTDPKYAETVNAMYAKRFGKNRSQGKEVNFNFNS